MPEQNFLSTIYAVARNAFREAVRDRVLYNLIVFVLLLTAAAIFLGELTAGQEARVVTDLGLSATLIFGVFIAIFVGVSLVWKEIEKRTVYSIFAKPVSRSNFIIGKYLGFCVTLLFNTLVMAVGITLALLYVGGTKFIAGVWPAAYLIFLEMTIITAVALVFSSFSTPALSALLTFFVFVIGHFSSSLRDLAQAMGSEAAVVFFNVIYYLLPNFSLFSVISNAAIGQHPPASMLGFATLYAVAYDIILLTLATMIFRRRNFK
ncbi:MAG: ABC-2 family transporter protein [Acidobacteria bacterium OLB17]|nr:MAG: ABC-2 family transporter protein [Acidobacteria bacterium OLB17]MCZ2389666.1 ABC transporter permease [Acidobacteriota bacterium]